MLATFIPAFLITFREALEAALIVVIVASYLKKIGKEKLHRYVYLGVIVAIMLSLLLGVSIFAVYGQLQSPAEEIFEGVAALTATAVLSYMIFWMAKSARKIRAVVEKKIDMAVTKGQMFGIVFLSFVAVFGEGVETVLFLTTLAFADVWATVAGLVVGCSIIASLAFVLYKSIYRLNIQKVFQYSSVLLIVFAAGLAGYGVHELLEAGEVLGIQFGVLGGHAFNVNPPLNPDGSYPPLHEKGAIGSIFAALVGYDGNPEWLRVIAYISYWLVVGVYAFRSFMKEQA
ncbi:MAG: FTR1 family protein [Candidatus Bathyarchaeia archaeon]